MDESVVGGGWQDSSTNSEKNYSFGPGESSCKSPYYGPRAIAPDKALADGCTFTDRAS